MIERENVQFLSEGVKCTGWFYRAKGKSGAPCIILGHGFGGVKELRLDAYSEAFVAEGYNALVFDYRHFGESDGEPRQILNIKKQHQDWRAAIRFARGIPGIDPRRIVLWGTSFSGGHVIAAAVQDNDIAAVISQVPHLDGLATAMAGNPIQNFRLSLAAWRDIFRQVFRRMPYYVPIVGQPGTLAAMTTPDAEEGVKHLCPEGFDYEENVAARIFLSVPFYSPGRLAPKLRVPWLLQAAADDSVTPVKPACKAALKAFKGQLIVYKCGHFDVYIPPYFDQTVGDQLTFLRNCLK